MKRVLSVFLCVVSLLAMAACGSQQNTENSQPSVSESGSSAAGSSAPSQPEESTPVSDDPSEVASSLEPSAENETDSNILIAYFSAPENVSTDGVDAVAGASVVVSDGEKLGNTQYVAQLIHQTVGGDLFRIETVNQYPLDHDPLLDYAADEQDADARPEMTAKVENSEQYDTILLGYPNWWYDMPMVIYHFVESYDFSGKTIIPFVTHGGSGASDSLDTIAELQPNAVIHDDPLILSRNDVAGGADTVIAWAESLGLKTTND